MMDHQHPSMSRYAAQIAPSRPPLYAHQAPPRVRHRSPSPPRHSPPHNWQPISALEAELDELGRAVVGLTRDVTPHDTARALEPCARYMLVYHRAHTPTIMVFHAQPGTDRCSQAVCILPHL